MSTNKLGKEFGLTKLYLFFYNVSCCIGWGYVLITSISHLRSNKNEFLWNTIEWPLKIVQTAAIMEIVHTLLRFVRSPVTSTIMQVSSRLFVLWAIGHVSPSSRYHWSLAMTVLSWSLVEVPRYSFYALNLIEKVPSFLFFLRYHLFAVLYPTGIIGEVSMMIKALPLLSTGVYSISLPNSLNLAVSLYLIVILVLALYIPGGPVMYMHMIAQRNRAYSKKKTL